MNNIRSASFVLTVVLAGCASVAEQEPAPVAQQTVPGPAPAPAAGTAERPAAPSAAVAPARAPTFASKTAMPGKRSVYFDFDRHDIKPEFQAVIEENAKYLRENPSLRIRIEGNSDERGSREYNVALGQRRAEAVMKTLALLGVAESRMEATSNGEEKPRALGHDESSWAENRRGDVVLNIR
jgi:peptidoglycan-associated lipoprotein